VPHSAQKISALTKEAPLTGLAEFGPVLRGETPAIHFMFWRNTTKTPVRNLIFFEVSWLAAMCDHRSHPSLFIG
jgi:hypothetical protein